MSKEGEFDSYEFLHGAALEQNSIGPTLPPIPAFTLPTGSTGPTGITGPTGSTGVTSTRFRRFPVIPKKLKKPSPLQAKQIYRKIY